MAIFAPRRPTVQGSRPAAAATRGRAGILMSIAVPSRSGHRGAIPQVCDAVGAFSAGHPRKAVLHPRGEGATQ
eukprot:3914269-Pyramimonas_sp.AAC.1